MQGAEPKPLILAFTPNTNLTVDFMTDIKDVIQSQDGSDLFDMDKGIINRACWFTGPRIVELKARVVIFSRTIYGLWSKIIMISSKITMIVI